MTGRTRRITASVTCVLIAAVGVALLRFDIGSQASQVAVTRAAAAGTVADSLMSADLVSDGVAADIVVIPPPAPFVNAARAASLSDVPANTSSFLDQVPPLYSDALAFYRRSMAHKAASALRERQLLAARRAAARAARQRARRQARRDARLARMQRPSGGLVVGDSVALGAKSCLAQLGYRVDAQIGRQFAVGLQRLRIHAEDGLPRTVVVHLGTNGPFTAADFESVMAVLGMQRRVVWVTIQLPQRSRYAFRDSLNNLIRDEASRYPNVRIADWASASAEKQDWLAGDGVHLGGEGCAGFTTVVDDAVTDPVAGS